MLVASTPLEFVPQKVVSTASSLLPLPTGSREFVLVNGMLKLSVHSSSSLANAKQQQHQPQPQQPQLQAMSEWHMDDIEQGLAANFEGSLSGLGVDLTTASFNMSEAMMSLASPPSGGKFATTAGSDTGESSATLIGAEKQLELQGVSREHPAAAGKFNISLSACTSPAVKVNEEPLTYLNQGQPYEVKLAFYGHGEKARLFRSVFRVSFHERRMQFMEKEHLDYWRQSRPGERILDIDIPLSYNLRDLKISPACINAAEVVWEGGGGSSSGGGSGNSSGGSSSGGGNGGGSGSSSDCGVFVKLHCISTEFTARKHGGEKGIPFRLQVDTFDQASGEHLFSAAAQVKVFKPKGADRKHKTDREKVERRAESERGKYQTSLPYTPFRPAALANGDAASAAVASLASIVKAEPKQVVESGLLVKQESVGLGSSSTAGASPKSTAAHSPATGVGGSGGGGISPVPADASASDESTTAASELTIGSSPRQVADWLERNRFGSGLVRHFANYTGADLLRLSRADLVEICGTANGVRLYNGLVQRPCRSKLMFFVGQESESVFHPVYLNNLTYHELLVKVAGLFQSDGEKISQILFYGPAGIPVCISDEMVSQLEAESRFALHVVPDSANSGRFKIFMKSLSAAAEANGH